MKILNKLKIDLEAAGFLAIIFGIPIGLFIWVGLEVHHAITAPTFYASAQISKIEIDRGNFVIAVKSDSLPLKGDVIYISSTQYATITVGDMVCLKYNKDSEENPQSNLEIVDDVQCQK